MSDLESKAKEAKTKNLIDTIISTMYARGARGYSPSRKIMESDAVKLIEAEIAKVDQPKRKVLKNETEYRLERFKEFMEEPEEVKRRVLKLARDKHVSFEQANEIVLDEET